MLTGTPSLSGFLDGRMVHVGRQLKQEMAADSCTSMRALLASETAMIPNVQLERPNARILLPPSTDEKAKDVSHTLLSLPPFKCSAPSASDQVYSKSASPTAMVSVVGEYASREQ